MLILCEFMSITQKDGQTNQKYSSEPHNKDYIDINTEI